MKRILIFIFLLPIINIFSQKITFTAVLEAASIPPNEETLRKELIENDYSIVNKSEEEVEMEQWAYLYNINTRKAASWVTIREVLDHPPPGVITMSGLTNYNYISIHTNMQIIEYLIDRIKKYCKYQGVKEMTLDERSNYYQSYLHENTNTQFLIFNYNGTKQLEATSKYVTIH